MSRFLCILILLCLIAFSDADAVRNSLKKLQTKQQQRSLQQADPAPAASVPPPAATTTPSAPAETAPTPTAPAAATTPAPSTAATTTPPPAAAEPAAEAEPAAAATTPAPATDAAAAEPEAAAPTDAAGSSDSDDAPTAADNNKEAITEEAEKEVSDIVTDKVAPRVDAAGNKIGLGWKEKLKQEQEKNAYFQPELKPATLADDDQKLSDEEIDKMAKTDFAPIDALEAANKTASEEAEGGKKEKGGAHSEFDNLINEAKELLAKVDEHFAKTGGPHVGGSGEPETPTEAAAGAEAKVAEGVAPEKVAENAAEGAEAAAQEASADATKADAEADKAKDEAGTPPAEGTPPAAAAAETEAKEKTADAAADTAKAADAAAGAAKEDAKAADAAATDAKDAPPAEAAKDAAAASTDAAKAGASADAAKEDAAATTETAKAEDPAADKAAGEAPPPPAALIVTTESAPTPVTAPIPMAVPSFVSMPMMIESDSHEKRDAIPTAAEMIHFREQHIPKNDLSMGAPVVPRPIS